MKKTYCRCQFCSGTDMNLNKKKKLKKECRTCTSKTTNTHTHTKEFTYSIPFKMHHHKSNYNSIHYHCIYYITSSWPAWPDSIFLMRDFIWEDLIGETKVWGGGCFVRQHLIKTSAWPAGFCGPHLAHAEGLHGSTDAETSGDIKLPLQNILNIRQRALSFTNPCVHASNGCIQL